MWHVRVPELDSPEQLRADFDRQLSGIEAANRTWQFGEDRDDHAAAVLHEALTELLGWWDSLSEARARVLRLQSWARQITSLTMEHPNRGADWSTVRDAIANSDTYGGRAVVPGDDQVRKRWLGLVPIGENPVTNLWEFYDLRSAWDGESNPAAIEVPKHEPDGTIKMTGATGIVFALLPGGDVTLGSQDEEPDDPYYDRDRTPDEVLHEVSLAPFLLARHELTQGQWRRLMTWDDELRQPSFYKAGMTVHDRSVTLANPVESVDWATCAMLLGRYGMVLPSEAQWEYGCRGGSHSAWCMPMKKLRECANLADLDSLGAAFDTRRERWRDGHAVHGPVATYAMNAFGLFDVHGNVAEWCLDPSGKYGTETGDSGYRIPSRGRGVRLELQVVRGGSYMTSAHSARSASRAHLESTLGIDHVGLRPARMLGL